ncbi:NUDIX domain-containing protein [Candidatus Roizmanbacteria bacterium]|nr:NUDIX domain-containing protein [Candidatus Roizmanbacteria bacterium]
MKFRNEVSAGGIVFKKVQEKILWLIVQHSQHKGWVFPKGLIGDKKENEPMEEAALREVGEEGGVKAKIIVKLSKPVSYMYRFKDMLIRKTVYYFLMEYISGDPKNHDWEVSDAKFLREEEIQKTLSFKSDKEAFEQALNLFLQKK